ncbi:divergent polysaccharide deacetylase family protein [Sulfurimonas sp. MAG313]|nr:divergent polysaccharide deacetylase family protein [Sulfurimonas sp. MAG313]MDF1880372.1 divergent polysaccharide deacetylase family protein [Sulfurimonas sp. MAG313]
MKKKPKKKGLKSTWALKVIIASLIILFVGLISIISYKQGYNNAEVSAKKEKKEVQDQQSELLSKITKIARPKHDLVERLQNVLSKDKTKTDTTKSIKKDSTHTKASTVAHTNRLGHPPKRPKAVVHKKTTHSKRARLAIIMDDVSFAHDVKSIKSLKIPITMSFLPPSPIHPNSAKLASREALYMVHLPLEAMTFSAEEPITLRISDSTSTINKRIRQVKKLFPRAYFVNNHTGSKFTSNKRAVKDLILALNKEGIGFLDSRTTAATKVPEVMKSLGQPYIARDLFLDHEANVAYIESQIKKAIKKAKKNGYAIAIGHPRKETLQALKNSKHLFKSVELVLVNKVI